MFCCIVGVTVAVASDSVHTFHVAMVGFLAAGLVFTTSSVNSLIYWSDPAKEAAAAGFILLSMVSVSNIHEKAFPHHVPYTNTLSSDRLDLSLRLPTHRLPPPHHGLLRAAPRRPRPLSQQQTHDPSLLDPYRQPPRNHPLRPATPNVQLLRPRGFRNLLTRHRLPRRRNRSAKPRIPLPLPATQPYPKRGATTTK